MMRTCFGPLLLAIAVGLSACAPATPGATTAPGEQERPPSRPSPTLVTVVRVEPTSLASRPLTFAGANVSFVVRVFNAELDTVDSLDRPRPYLAEALPQLNTDSWRILPDGHMETSYRLKPNLTWHDGVPLTSDDFVFALKVFKTPELGVSGMTPITWMDEIQAPDPRTIVIRWRTAFPDAGVLSTVGTYGNGGFQPLPRHLLETSFAQDTTEAFANHAYWVGQYVGLGPYKLERWEPGSFVEGSAFDGHVWGRPKIDRIQVKFMADENTVLANLLAQTVHLATDRSIRYEHTQIMRRDWDSNHQGVVLLTLSNVRYILMQNRPGVRQSARDAGPAGTAGDCAFDRQASPERRCIRWAGDARGYIRLPRRSVLRRTGPCHYKVPIRSPAQRAAHGGKRFDQRSRGVLRIGIGRALQPRFLGGIGQPE